MPRVFRQIVELCPSALPGLGPQFELVHYVPAENALEKEREFHSEDIESVSEPHSEIRVRIADHRLVRHSDLVVSVKITVLAVTRLHRNGIDPCHTILEFIFVIVVVPFGHDGLGGELAAVPVNRPELIELVVAVGDIAVAYPDRLSDHNSGNIVRELTVGDVDAGVVNAADVKNLVA